MGRTMCASLLPQQVQPTREVESQEPTGILKLKVVALKLCTSRL